MNKIIVFGNCLQNTVGLVRSMGESGFKVDLLIEPCKRSDCFIKFSKYVNQIYYLVDINDAPTFLLEKYGNETEKPVILCGSDPTINLLDRNYERLKDFFLIFNANGEQGRISKYLDKIKTFQVAEKHGLTLIPTWQMKAGDVIPTSIVFPVFVKGDNSVKSTKADIHICKNPHELQSSLREGISYFVQEYIQMDYELNIIGFAYNHGKKVILPGAIRKIRQSLVRMGEFMRLDDIHQYPNINIEGIKNLVAEIGYEGIFSVEFLCTHDKCYFLEINLRNDALGYIYSAAGANYPLLWYKYATGNLFDEEIDRIRIKTPFYVMHENDLYNIFERKVTVNKWFRDFIKSDAFLIMNRRDPLPFIVSTLIHVRQMFKKLIRTTGIDLK